MTHDGIVLTYRERTLVSTSFHVYPTLLGMDLSKIIFPSFRSFRKSHFSQEWLSADGIHGEGARSNRDEHGRTPLHYAAASGHERRVLERLCYYGWSVSDRDQLGFQPIHYAATSKYSLKEKNESVEALVRLGADSNSLTRGFDVIHLVLTRSHVSTRLIQSLRDQGCSILKPVSDFSLL